MLSRLAYAVVIIVVGGSLLLLSRIPQVRLVESLLFEALGPAEKVLAVPTVRIDQIGQAISRVGQLEGENARLRAEIDQLSSEAVRVPELERENAELRAELGFQHDNPQDKWVTARLIGFDPSNLVQAIIVDQGSRSGIAEGMTVVTPRGLVGQVVQVSPNTSKILLVTDVSSSVNGQVQTNGARGVVSGSRVGQLTMAYIPQGMKVQTGDRVVTSGLGGVFPAGIWVGTVTDVRQNDTDLFQSALLEPAVDFGRIEQVMIIVNHLPTKLD